MSESQKAYQKSTVEFRQYIYGQGFLSAENIFALLEKIREEYIAGESETETGPLYTLLSGLIGEVEQVIELKHGVVPEETKTTLDQMLEVYKPFAQAQLAAGSLPKDMSDPKGKNKGESIPPASAKEKKTRGRKPKNPPQA